MTLYTLYLYTPGMTGTTISHHAPKKSALAGDEGFEGGWFVDHGWLVGPGIPERLSKA